MDAMASKNKRHRTRRILPLSFLLLTLSVAHPPSASSQPVSQGRLLAVLVGKCEETAQCQNQTQESLVELLARRDESMNGYYVSRRCFCDPLCHLYGTCCQDVGKVNLGSSAYDIEEMTKQAECLNFGAQYNFQIFMIRTCPEKKSVPNHTRALCLGRSIADPLTYLPVSEIQTGLTFANVFCAICHRAGTETPQVAFWDYRCLPVKGTVSQFNLISKALCTGAVKHIASITPPMDAEWPSFCRHPALDCHLYWPDDEVKQRCLNHTAFVYHLIRPDPTFIPTSLSATENLYRNKYCAECSLVPENETTCIPTILPDFSSALDDVIEAVNIRNLFSFHRQRSRSGTSRCRGGFVYDGFRQKCRRVFCTGTETITTDGRCACLGDNHTLCSEEWTNCTCCALTYLNSSDYLPRNGSILVKAANVSLPSDCYFKVLNDTVAVCASIFEVPKLSGAPSSSNLIESSITLVGYGISLVCMAVAFIVYFLFPCLRSLPGKVMVTLITNLFCAQCLFLILPFLRQNPTACKLLSICTHYFYLATFAWMNVSAFDIWKAFSDMMPTESPSRTLKRYRLYCLHGWGAPLVVVIAAVLMDSELILVPKNLQPGYGAGRCWITNVQATMVFFAVPLGAVLLSNAVFFCVTMGNLCRISESLGSVSSMFGLSKKTYLMVCVKMTVTMGLTWVFGFLANAAPDSPVLWYIFILFGSLQGVFIGVAFTCNNKVLGLLRKRLSGVSERAKN